MTSLPLSRCDVSHGRLDSLAADDNESTGPCVSGHCVTLLRAPQAVCVCVTRAPAAIKRRYVHILDSISWRRVCCCFC